MSGTKESCECIKCKQACTVRPGWFLPGQVDILLNHFNAKSIRELLPHGFAIDWWQDSPKDILVLAPNITGNLGIQYPGNPQGTCVFFKDEKCAIHKIKPFECSELICGDGDKVPDRHEEVAKQWKGVHTLDDITGDVWTEGFSLFDSLLGGY